MLLSLKTESYIPEQKLEADVQIGGFHNFINYVKAAASSFVVSILPAVGAAQAAGLSQSMVKFKDKEDFLMIVGGINTAKTITI